MAVDEGRITLDDKYSIVVGDLSYDLVSTRAGKTKKGEDKIYEKNIGYYGTLKAALKAYVRCDIAEKFRGKQLEINDAVRIIQAAESKLDRLLCDISPSEL